MPGHGYTPGRAAETASGQARRLPLPRRARPGALHRQGEVAAAARALVLPGHAGLALDDPAATGAGRRRRGDRHEHRGRGAAPGAEPGQAPPPAVQRPPARRQVVPVHRGHRRGRLPARDVHARAAPARGRLLRPVREREEGARDARRAQPRLPVPALRGPEARPPQRDSVPRLPHRALPGAVRRLHLEGRLPPDHRQRDRVPLRRDAADPARARAEDEGRRRGRALRGGGALPQPAVRGAAPGRAAGGRPALGRQRRRDRARRRGRPRGGADLPAARRAPDRPLRLPPRERRGPGRRRRCSRRSRSSTTARRRACRRRSSSRRTRATRARWSSSSPTGAARTSRCARRCAARSGGCRSWRPRTRGSRSSRRWCRPSASACAGSRRSRSCARR